MKIRLSAGLAAGLVVWRCSPRRPRAAPATVTVRVEGAAHDARATTRDAARGRVRRRQAGHDLRRARAPRGALDAGRPAATGTRQRGSTASATESSSASRDAFDRGLLGVLGRRTERPRARSGVCDAELQNGDDVALLPRLRDRRRVRAMPLRAHRRAGAARRAGPVTVHALARVRRRPATGATAPVAGATGRRRGRRATTGADGTRRRHVQRPRAGDVKATKPGTSRSATARRRASRAGADGACGSRRAGRARHARRRSPTHRRHPRRPALLAPQAPRELHGTVTADPSGLWAVKLRLTRKLGKHLLVLLRHQGAVPQARRAASSTRSRSATEPTGATCCRRGCRAGATCSTRTRSTTRSTTARHSA